LSENTMVVEEPESNLHPLAQTKLAESMARALESIERTAGPAFPLAIMETHSEHILKRFQQLIFDDKLKDEDIQIIYVEQKDGKTTVRALDTQNGNLTEPINQNFSDNPTFSSI